MVSDPPYRTFDEIQRYLGISKSAVSNALNSLMTREMVDYITMPGDRKRYFQLASAGLISQMKKKIGLHSVFPQLLREVVESRSNKYPEFNKRLLETSEFLAFMEKEIGAAIDRWEAMQAKKS
jgi:DNA-binding transcriptional regulator GbsR (MarR family)